MNRRDSRYTSVRGLVWVRTKSGQINSRSRCHNTESKKREREGWRGREKQPTRLGGFEFGNSVKRKKKKGGGSCNADTEPQKGKHSLQHKHTRETRNGKVRARDAHKRGKYDVTLPKRSFIHLQDTNVDGVCQRVWKREKNTKHLLHTKRHAIRQTLSLKERLHGDTQRARGREKQKRGHNNSEQTQNKNRYIYRQMGWEEAEWVRERERKRERDAMCWVTHYLGSTIVYVFLSLNFV